MTHSPLRGILVALITPLTEDGSAVDTVAIKPYVDRLVDAGVHGLVPGGSSGEFTALTVAERKHVTEEVVAAAAGRVPVVAGTGALTTAETAELSRHAAEVGASALMVVPPFYEVPSLAEVKEHLAAAYEASGLPIMYYNLPAMTGVELSAAEIAELGDLAGVEYLKDTSGNAPAFAELIVAHSDRITAFNGWDTLTFFGLASGAKGSVWGATNLIPELSVQLWDAVAERGDLEEGRRIWAKIWPICNVLESYTYPAALKAGLDLVGQPAGPLRKPYSPLPEEARAELKGLLQDAGVI